MAQSHGKIMNATKGPVGDFIRRYAHTDAVKNETIINRLKNVYMTDDEFMAEFKINLRQKR